MTVESRGVGVLIAAIVLLAPSPSRAQDRCVAAIRGLAAQSPRARIRELRDARVHHDVIGDGASCVRDSAALVVRALALGPYRARGAIHWPEVRSAFLGGVADARTDGAMWSGRGANLQLSGGASLDVGALHVLVAPALWWSENRWFDVYGSRDTSRNVFASPWYSGDYSMDFPLRFGAAPFVTLDPGESAIWGEWKNVRAGVSTSTQGWGPGLRGRLLLGQDAPGIPRFFAGSLAPLMTPAGSISAVTFLGRLVESRFFDFDPANDTRWLWGLTAAYSPGQSGIATFGFTNGVMWSEAPGRTSEMMTTLYAEVRSPQETGRAWLEVGRMGLPPLGEFLRVPYSGIAYLAGFEYGAPVGRGVVLVSAEAANLEQPTDNRDARPQDFYTSDEIAHGWSHRGRPLGTAGPGTQSQWLGVDWVAGRWSSGVFGERVRWHEDAFLREYLPYPNRHDVSLRFGIKAGAVFGQYEATMELSTGKRLNYLFQNGSYIPGLPTVDVRIPQLRVRFVPISR